jgi:ABC-type transport system involved in cytochrome c biogenesis permease subunit
MNKHARWVVLACWLTAATLPAARDPVEAFQRLVIQDQGRLKPMDTFARNLLRQISGRSSLNGEDASAWLARVFFTPRETLDDRIFRVARSDVLEAIGIDGKGRGRRSFTELRPGLGRLHELAFRFSARNTSRPGRFESEVIRLFFNISAYYGLLDAFAFARPEGAITGASPRSPAILPLTGGPDEPWLSAVQAQALGSSLPAEVRKEITLLTQAARAYAGRRQAEFGEALDAFSRSRQSRLGSAAASPAKISLEILYNRSDPFFRAELAYGLSLLLLLLSLGSRRPLLERLSAISLLAGFLAHSFGLLARMVIMGRPPVTNLYETFVFVAWTAVAVGLLLAWLQKRGLGLLAGGLAGLAFLVVAGRYALDGDTMGMLAAVLDSNLWLAAHVVTIALGYAGCVVAGIIGHAAIIQQILKPRGAAASGTARSLYAVLAFGLVFTSIGTLMGGIWADQSWGRFWGWDPKENGALLIIVWCAALLHARLAGWIGPIGLAAGSIGSIIAVIMAWFGVNLLGVGLHAYGFTSGTARGLVIFVAAELAFLAAAVPLAHKKKRG